MSFISGKYMHAYIKFFHFNLKITLKLYKLQEQLARIITSSSYEVRSADIFKTLHWEPTDNILTNANK